MTPVTAQQQNEEHRSSHDVSSHGHHEAGVLGGWEGSREGIAYSEFNHHVAGLLLLLIGLSEMNRVIRLTSPFWTRMLLPSALGVVGIFVLVWSDHEAWPIGRLSFADSFFGNDPEIVQHKLYGLLALTVSIIEICQRWQWIRHKTLAIPLPLFAVVGGVMLFAHSHGAHPGAEKIALHHAVMGAMAITAGSAKFVSAWMADSPNHSARRWELVWAGCILLIAAQLLIYSE